MIVDSNFLITIVFMYSAYISYHIPPFNCNFTPSNATYVLELYIIICIIIIFTVNSDQKQELYIYIYI